MADALDNLPAAFKSKKGCDKPKVITIGMLASAKMSSDFSSWLSDRKNRRAIPHKLLQIGYMMVRNPDSEDGLWRIAGKRQTVYARKDLSVREQIAAAMELAGQLSALKINDRLLVREIDA